MFKYSFIAAVAALGVQAAAQVPTTLPAKNIDRLAETLLQQQAVSGITILLIKDGKTIYNKAFGTADASGSIPMKTNSIFRIASQTKAVTSLAAMLLWEEGKFLLDEPVSKYIPEFKNPQVLADFHKGDSTYTTVAAKREITIRDLLRHTSGISYPVFSIDERMSAIYAKDGIATGIGSAGVLADQIRKLGQQPLLHQPGTAFTYGLNTDVLGYLIELWSAMPLEAFLRQRIFEPLAMHDTYFRIPEKKSDRLVALMTKGANGFVAVNAPIYEGNAFNYPLQEGVYASGGAGLSSTTADYARFLQLFLNNGKVDGKQLIGSRTIALMLTNQLAPGTKINGEDENFQFGLGFSLVTEKNKFLHSIGVGSFYWGGAFNTHYWVDPKEKLIGIVFTQEYMPESYWDLGYRFKNVIYSTLASETLKK